MQCRVTCVLAVSRYMSIGCSKQNRQEKHSTAITVFGQTPQSTFRARKILYWQNVTNMVSCQLPTIECNLPFQVSGSYKTVTYTFWLSCDRIFTSRTSFDQETHPSKIVLLKASTLVPTTTRRVFACNVSPQDLNSLSRISNHTPMNFLSRSPVHSRHFQRFG